MEDGFPGLGEWGGAWGWVRWDSAGHRDSVEEAWSPGSQDGEQSPAKGVGTSVRTGPEGKRPYPGETGSRELFYLVLLLHGAALHPVSVEKEHLGGLGALRVEGRPQPQSSRR